MSLERLPWVWGAALSCVIPQGLAAQDLPAQTRQAITHAVDFLAQAQQPEGAFLAYRCWGPALTTCPPDRSESSMEHTPNTPVLGSTPTALVLRGLLAVGTEDPRTAVLVEKAAQWLRAQMDTEGLFGYYRMTDPEAGPQCVGEFRQLFPTALNRSVLEPLGFSLPQILPLLATYQTSDGVFFPFAIPAAEVMAITAGGSARERFYERYRLLVQDDVPVLLEVMNFVYPLPNAEVFGYLVQHGQVSAALCAYLVHAVQREQIETYDPLFGNPYMVAQAVSRAYALGASCLEPARDTLQRRLLELQRSDGSWGSIMETAVAASCLMYFGYTGEALDRSLVALIRQQQVDGAWEAVLWRTMLAPIGKSPLSWFGSEEVSTGHVLETLGQYLAVQQVRTL